MNITISPFGSQLAGDMGKRSINDSKVENGIGDKTAYRYWGIYLDNEQVSYTSTRELAEKTKVWMEKWLSEKN